MLLWFKEFVTAAGIDASLCNTVTQCAIGACVCEWNMSHSASVNRSDSPVTLLYTACYVTRDARFFIRTLNILFFGFLTFSWISWWLIQRWRRGRWSTNTQPFSRGWVPIFVFLRLTKLKLFGFMGRNAWMDAENWAKRLQKSSDCWRHWTIFSFCFWGASSTFLSVCRPSSPVYLHTHTHTPDTTLNLRAPSCLSVIDIPLW